MMNFLTRVMLEVVKKLKELAKNLEKDAAKELQKK
jgi:hypothetical protein